MNSQEDKHFSHSNPVKFGMVILFLFSIVLACSFLGLVYYKHLADISRTRQPACPIAKFCPAGTENTGYHYGLSTLFPTDYSDYSDGEVLTFPYYDSFSSPTQKNMTITIDKTTGTVPSGGNKFMNITDVGYSGSSPDFTVYISGLSSYSDVSGIFSALLSDLMKSSNSPVKKEAFMSMDNKTGKGYNFFNYKINVNTGNENYYDLSVSSNTSSSTLLSGTNNLVFNLSENNNPDHLVNVYNDFNSNNKNNVAKSLIADSQNSKYSYCVEPSFVADTCDGRTYDTDCGLWYPDGQEAVGDTCTKIQDSYDDYDDDLQAGGIPFCSFNLDKNNKYNDRASSDGGSRNTGVGSYQTNGFGDNIISGITNTGNSPSLSYTAGNDGVAKTGSDLYDQSLLFCGGNTKDSNNLRDTSAVTTQPYESKFPNKDTAAKGNNLGWSS